MIVSVSPYNREQTEKIHKLFCEVVIAPSYEQEAIEILKGKKNRIILIQKEIELPKANYRTASL